VIGLSLLLRTTNAEALASDAAEVTATATATAILLQGDSVSSAAAYGPVHSAVCGAGWERRRHRRATIIANSSSRSSTSSARRRSTCTGSTGGSSDHQAVLTVPVTFAAVVCELMR
jgi:hypothetical protein